MTKSFPRQANDEDQRGTTIPSRYPRPCIVQRGEGNFYSLSTTYTMGQEASVHRNGDPDEAPTNHPTPASPPRGGAWRTTAFGDKIAAAAAAAAETGGAGQRERPPGETPYQQPQSQKQLQQLQQHAAGAASAAPPPRHPRPAADPRSPAASPQAASPTGAVLPPP